VNLDRIRQLVAELSAAVNDQDTRPAPREEAPFGINPLREEAPFGINPLTGSPNLPPALSGAVRLIDVATAEAWPGPRDRPWSKWDYLRGIRTLGVGGHAQAEPIYPLERHLQQFEDDVHALAASEKGRAFLAAPENRVGIATTYLTLAAYLTLAGVRPVSRLPDGTLREYE